MKKNKVVAFVPARRGSKSIPLKNIKNFAGKPLIYWVLLASQLSVRISEVYVSTDSKKIKDQVNSFDFSKVTVIERSPNTATDTASTESAMLEFAKRFDFSHIILLQATSPLVSNLDLNRAVTKYFQGEYDSLLSGVIQKRFLWKYDKKEKIVQPINYDYFNRPRRQEFEGYLVENGAFYITSREDLLKTKNRMSGRIGFYEMSPYTYCELDEREDWKLLESLAFSTKKHYLNYWTKDIKAVALDVDGVLTDGGVYTCKCGENPEKFSRVDGKGIELLRKNNIQTWIISAEDSEVIRKRCKKIQIKDVYLGIKNKLSVLEKLANKYSLNKDDICFIGDDIQDIPVINWAGFSAAPCNAVESVKNQVQYVSSKTGGAGAVRDVIDVILSNKKETHYE
jgi:N-acylneuraminate cytidylyltransferase